MELFFRGVAILAITVCAGLVCAYSNAHVFDLHNPKMQNIIIAYGAEAIILLTILFGTAALFARLIKSRRYR